jgi:hypothetical protein
MNKLNLSLWRVPQAFTLRPFGAVRDFSNSFLTSHFAIRMLGLVNGHDYIVLCTRRSLSPLETQRDVLQLDATTPTSYQVSTACGSGWVLSLG